MGILFCKVAIRITNQVLSALDEAIDASTQPSLSFIPDSNTRWELNEIFDLPSSAARQRAFVPERWLL